MSRVVIQTHTGPKTLIDSRIDAEHDHFCELLKASEAGKIILIQLMTNDYLGIQDINKSLSKLKENVYE